MAIVSLLSISYWIWELEVFLAGLAGSESERVLRRYRYFFIL
jgi:hypothetical protein